MIKRLFDIVVSGVGLLLLWPFLLLSLLLIWLQDFCNPFYIAPRSRTRNTTFNMVKLRSMVKNAEKVGGASTATNDRRITWVGRLIRKTKFDEVPQLWNVLVGDMSLVGPRPQVTRDVTLYTEEEYHLFDVRPGITDISSIVFADEGEILEGAKDPDLRYHQIIRPWKSRLGLLYVRNHNLFTDLKLIAFTVSNFLARNWTLRQVSALVKAMHADEELVLVASRTGPLHEKAPPGLTEVVNSRD